MLKKLLIFILLPFLGAAQIPDYYIGIDFTLEGNPLKNQLSNLIIATHAHELIYTPEVWQAVKTADLVPGDTEHVLLLYGYDDTDGDPKTDRTRHVDESCHTSSCNGKWVREHTYPKSLGDPPLGTSGPGSDAHHIRPIDNQMNNWRSNRKFADGNGVAHITPQGHFYPGDEWKGDVARMMMYMHLRYGQRTPANNVSIGDHNWNAEMPDIFLKWNAEDLPADQEIVRNSVLEDMQGNRNPFIDNPYLATKIWGGLPAENYWIELSTQELTPAKAEIYPNPAADALHIKSGKEIEYVSLYSLAAETLLNQKKIRNSQLDLSGIQSGNYILLISYKDRSKETQKVMVKK